MTKSPEIVLCHMPWATTLRPSIALGILSRLADECGVEKECLYPNLDLAAMTGFEVAGRFANDRALYGMSEHLFSVDIFGPDVLKSEEYLQAFHAALLKETKEGWVAKFSDIDFLRELRDTTIPRFLDKIEARIVAAAPRVVGFSSTFNQVMASLALGRRLKKSLPGVKIIAGGACFDGEMGQEYHRALPEVLDHVFLGEAEESFREFLRRIKSGEATDGIPGVTYWRDGRMELVPGRPLADLNESPTPDYDSFFAETERIRKETNLVFNIEYLPFESARGCWWGQKNHCVFCGINRDLMGFRPKDVNRMVQEIVLLSARYQAVKLTATDWIISRWHCDEFFQRLIDLDLDLEFFYEVRADMKKAQMMKMKQAGVVQVQPGIESFSTPLLQLMKKGTTAIRHVMFLRWCREIGIHVAYNILAGFPGEQPVWYRDMTSLISRISHLQPPLSNVHFVEMHRFSPLFEQREKFGVDDYDLRTDYKYNMPEGRGDRRKMGYFFQYHSSMKADEGEYVESVRAALEPWLEKWKAKEMPKYEYIIGPGFLQIHDTRQGQGRYLKLADLYQDVVLLCDEVQGRRSLAKDLEHIYPQEVSNGTLDRVIDELVAADVLLSEGNQLLTLPVAHRVRTTEELRSYVLGKDYAAPAERREGGALQVLTTA